MAQERVAMKAFAALVLALPGFSFVACGSPMDERPVAQALACLATGGVRKAEIAAINEAWEARR